MSIKNTRIWLNLRKAKNYFYHVKRKRAQMRRYNKAKNMSEYEYKAYLCRLYEERMNEHDYTKGKTLNLDNPQSFSEKCQWLKLYDRDPRKPIYSDKYAVRKIIKDTIGEEYLIPLISIDGRECFSNAKDINFDKLPNQFVIKCNHGSHMNYIIKDKKSLTKNKIKKIKKQLNKWLKIDYTFWDALETQYSGIKPCLLIEEYMGFIEEVLDYKFLCFGGEPKFFWISQKTTTKDSTSSLFNLDFTNAEFQMNLGYIPPCTNIQKPENFDKMIEIARKLAFDFRFVRVDLYNFNGRIYFGELTFNSSAGYDVPNPVSYDIEVGKLLNIN